MVSLPHEYRNKNTERVRLWDWEWDIDENIIYGEGLPLDVNIHQINEDIGYSRWTISNVLVLSQNYHCGKWLGNIIIYVVLLFGILCMFVVIWY